MKPPDAPQTPQNSAKWYCRRFAIITLLFLIGVVLYLDAPLEGEYRGDFTDSISGRAILVLKGGQIFIRGIDGIETLFASYERVNGEWIVTFAGGSEWRLDRDFWGFKVITGNDVEYFRRRYPFEKVFVQFPE